MTIDIREGAQRLRVFVGDDTRAEHKPLYRAVLDHIHERGLWGASVYRGWMGYGTHHRVHSMGSEYTMMGLPIVIECIDKAERIASVLPELRALVQDGLITVEDVSVVTLLPEA